MAEPSVASRAAMTRTTSGAPGAAARPRYSSRATLRRPSASIVSTYRRFAGTEAGSSVIARRYAASASSVRRSRRAASPSASALRGRSTGVEGFAHDPGVRGVVPEQAPRRAQRAITTAELAAVAGRRGHGSGRTIVRRSYLPTLESRDAVGPGIARRRGSCHPSAAVPPSPTP